MRIISGEARGRTITAPSGMNTRPTQDYVRESLFNILRFDVIGAHTLDLFAGTGALSLESVSRGAEHAVLVDMDRAACACIRKNMETTRLGDRCRLIQRSYLSAIEQLSREGERFDIVFLDPPYRMTNTGEMCAQLLEAGLLKPDSMLIVEHRGGCAPMFDARFEAFDQRKYGETVITFVRLRREETPDEDAALSGKL